MHKISRQSVTFRFSDEQDPVLTVDPGDQILFETKDAHNGTVPEGAIGDDVGFEELTDTNANPVTGLVYVRNAEVGDTLVVRIESIKLVGSGYVPVRPQMGILFQMSDQNVARVIHVAQDKWLFNQNLSFPVRPMIGTIGTALPGKGIATMHPGDHGGNIDNNYVKEGALVHLPVNVPGALLGLGDVHASMGDGEATGGGIDICSNVTVTVDLIKGGGLSHKPYIIFDGLLVTCGHGSTVVQAIEDVTRETIDIISTQAGLAPREAYQLISAMGDVGLSQAANCLDLNVTTRISVPMFWKCG